MRYWLYAVTLTTYMHVFITVESGWTKSMWPGVELCMVIYQFSASVTAYFHWLYLSMKLEECNGESDFWTSSLLIMFIWQLSQWILPQIIIQHRDFLRLVVSNAKQSQLNEVQSEKEISCRRKDEWTTKYVCACAQARLCDGWVTYKLGNYTDTNFGLLKFKILNTCNHPCGLVVSH